MRANKHWVWYHSFERADHVVQQLVYDTNFDFNASKLGFVMTMKGSVQTLNKNMLRTLKFTFVCEFDQV